jgi:hypothetical protein
MRRRRCRREFLRIYELMKIRIFDAETNRIQSRIYTTLRTFILRPKTSKSIHPKYTRNEQSIYRLKELVISYNRDDYRRHSFDNYPTYLTTRITNKREYIHLCITGRMPIRKMSIKTLRSTPIRIGRLYHRWIRINKTNKTHV